MIFKQLISSDRVSGRRHNPEHRPAREGAGEQPASGIFHGNTENPVKCRQTDPPGAGERHPS